MRAASIISCCARARWRSRARCFRAVAVAAALAATGASPGCGCNGKFGPRPYPEPTAEQVLDHLAEVRASARSFRATSVMDYWVGDDRVKGEVLVMGRKGARVRFNALSPTGGNVLVDLACDGIGFQLIDYQNDCQLTGPCTKSSIARLLKVSLEPDDFLLLAMGTTPVIEDAAGTVTWDADTGREKVELSAVDNQLHQTIVLDGRDRRWDVLLSEMRNARGEVLWRLQNRDYREVRAEDGATFRVPGKTKFEQPMTKADLLVRWEERTLNVELDTSKFQMEIPAGLKACGKKQ